MVLALPSLSWLLATPTSANAQGGLLAASLAALQHNDEASPAEGGFGPAEPQHRLKQEGVPGACASETRALVGTS